ncbi:MAG TPA: hypothetical protein DCZ94_12655 [Lentisphaeria bacterium]|nr:MAG: hypothetical protein A2X48_21345 [Lentisphaerae bacterium GWF2_49_21]HBC87797.1 hypothetical protein [Lentisphaeria bacterium]
MPKIVLPEAVPFDYQYLMQVLRDYSSPRNKINLMLRNKEMIRIKKGLYVKSLERADPFVLACLIYGPSYVSMESALSYLGLIPERVEAFTCMTSKRNKSFTTPAGRFSYCYLNNTAFSTGVDIASGKSGSFFIATPEKAICDRTFLVKKLRQRDVEQFLEKDLRIDLESLKLDTGRLRNIGNHYKDRSVQSFIGWYLANRKEA